MFMHPTYQTLRRALAEKNMTIADLARLMDWSEQRIQNWKNRGVPPRVAAHVAMALGVNRDAFLQEGSLDEITPGPIIVSMRRVPIVGIAQLGPDGYWCDNGYPAGSGDGYLEVPSKDPNAYAVRVRGESMTPAIRDGWVVLVEPNTEPVPGAYVLIRTVDGQCMVKELLFADRDHVSVCSVNDGFARLTFRREEIEKIHYVAGAFHGSKATL